MPARLALALLLCAPAIALGQYTFADVPWGASKSQVREKLAKAGFGRFSRDADGDIMFEGRHLGERVQGFAYFDGMKLVKVMTIATPARGEHHKAYKRLHESLVAKHGAPKEQHAGYLPPYRAGDGKEAQAFKEGRAVFSSRWEAPAAGSAFASILPDFTVGVAYESPQWEAVQKARSAQDAGKGK
jgi:hypothetical protein